MKNFVITLLENTDPSISVRISILCYGSRQKKFGRKSLKLYIRVGRLVVSTAIYPRATVLTTLRDTLTALAIFPEYLNKANPSRLRVIRDFSEKRFCAVKKKKYIRYPLESLLKEASLSMALIQSSLCGGHLRLRSTHDVRSSLHSLMQNVFEVIELMQRHPSYSEKLAHYIKQGK